MSNSKFSFKKLITNQWSYVYAGVLFAIAQIIYMIAIWLYKSSAGKTPNLMHISVTTDLGRMFRGMEVFINNAFGFYSELYGEYGIDAAGNIIDGNTGVFSPGIGWPILGMIIGGYLVTRMENEFRGWAYYSKKALIVSFIGGAFFSYGTRLAGGCTLTHLMGGIPFMGIRSFGSVIFMAMGGALGFLFMEKMGLANYFKHQETKAYVMNADAGEQATYKPGYNWKKNPIFWIASAFTILFLVAALYGSFGADSMKHLNGNEIVAFGKSIADKSGLFVVLTLLSGIVAGIALSKSGYGTECSLVSLETSGDMTKNDKKYAKMGVPKITRTLMRSYAPMVGVVTTWVIMLIFMLIAWSFFGVSPALGNSVKAGLTAGNFIGGLFLGFGAVTLIGCEIRSYMRIGMGYLNTLVGFIGFAIGYLPYTLFYSEHKHFLDATVLFGTHADGTPGLISTKRELYSLITDDPTMQKVIMFAWMILLALFLRYLIKKGAKNIGLQPVNIIHQNTEDIQDTIDSNAKDGKIGEVDAPQDVPEIAYAKK